MSDHTKLYQENVLSYHALISTFHARVNRPQIITWGGRILTIRFVPLPVCDHSKGV